MIHKSLLIENFFKFAFLFFYISIRFFVLCCLQRYAFFAKKKNRPFLCKKKNRPFCVHQDFLCKCIPTLLHKPFGCAGGSTDAYRMDVL